VDELAIFDGGATSGAWLPAAAQVEGLSDPGMHDGASFVRVRPRERFGARFGFVGIDVVIEDQSEIGAVLKLVQGNVAAAGDRHRGV
jgi:hypothetical protein